MQPVSLSVSAVWRVSERQMALSYLTISAAAAVDTSLSPPDKLAASAAAVAGYDDTELGIEKLEEEGMD